MVLLRHIVHRIEVLLFGEWLIQIERLLQEDIRWHGLGDEFIYALHSDYFQHLLLVLLCQTNVSAFQVVSFHNILFLELKFDSACKVTTKNAHLQENERKVYFSAKFACKWAA